MPKLDSQMFTPAGTEFSYGATPPGKLGADSYTLVNLAWDVSPSVSKFAKELVTCANNLVRACIHSPRRDNLLVRTEVFSDVCREIHGFKPFTAIDLDTNDPNRPDEYNLAMTHAGGGTALCQSTANGYLALKDYGKTLKTNRYDVNGFKVVFTDGEENMGGSLDDILKAKEDLVSDESLESIVSVLVGVNLKTSRYKKYLDDFHKEAQFDKFIALEDASDKSFAKLVGWLVSSVSAQSQQVGTGQPSQLLVF